MSSLVSFSGGSGAGPPSTTLPTLSSALAVQVRLLSGGGAVYPGDDPDDPGLRVAAPQATFDPVARDALAEVERRCFDDVGGVSINAWLAHLAAGMAKPPNDRERAMRAGAVRIACTDIPAGCWNSETLAEAMRTFEWWPGAKRIHALLRQHADRLFGVRDALRKIVAAGPPRPRPPPKPDERLDPAAQVHVHAVVAAFAAERSFNQPQAAGVDTAGTVKPLPLSDGALLAAYEKLAADGVPGADIRLAMLRARISEPPA